MIIVFGSINRDILFKAKKLPKAGETILCEEYDISTGGKGANQALAASRFGNRVALVGKIGDDNIGMNILNNLRRMGVMTSGVAKSEDKPTGCATVIRDENGKNQTIIAPGANQEALAEQVPSEVLGEKNFVLMQMELPPEQNIELAKHAKECGATTMLNLAPAETILPGTLDNIDYLLMNETEAIQLAAFLKIEEKEDEEELAQAIAKKAGLNCIITRAERGSVACTKDGELMTVKAAKIEDMADSVGAGDAYCGTLAACLHNGENLNDAMKKASVAASLSCLEEGAHDSFVYQNDIEEYLKNEDL